MTLEEFRERKVATNDLEKYYNKGFFYSIREGYVYPGNGFIIRIDRGRGMTFTAMRNRNTRVGTYRHKTLDGCEKYLFTKLSRRGDL